MKELGGSFRLGYSMVGWIIKFKDTLIVFPYLKRVLGLIFILPLLSACSTSVEDDLVSSQCIQPPLNLPKDWSKNVHPNCFKNISRLGQWTGGTKVLSVNDDPSSYFKAVQQGSIGTSGKPVHLYVIAHGWAPGLRKAVDTASGNLQWWSSKATYAGKWESNWAWTGINGKRKTQSGNVLDITPTGLIQQIESYEAAQGNKAETVVLLYSWVDDSATHITQGGNWDTWSGAAYSEAYTNLNGLRLANAIETAITPKFFSTLGNKVHILGHSHGTKVSSVATLELQKKDKLVEHLSLFDSPENDITLDSNSANLLGYYFDKMKIATPAQLPSTSSTFVESYVSMFGYGYKGPSGSAINNVTQVGLDSAGIFDDLQAADRHAYSASWYSNAWAATKGKGWPSAGLDWPPVVSSVKGGGTHANGLNSYQDFPYCARYPFCTTYPTAKEQWHLWNGGIEGADSIGYGYSHYTNPSIKITEVSKSGLVFGNPATVLSMPASLSGVVKQSAFVGKFDARTSGLWGLSFDIKWDQAQPKGFVVVTVQSPAIGSQVSDQQIALVFDASASINDKTWHPVSFNTFALPSRTHTQFEIHYFPDNTNRNNPSQFSVRDFRYVKETGKLFSLSSEQVKLKNVEQPDE